MSNEEYLNNMNVQYLPVENEDNYEYSDSNESSNIQLNNPELNRGIITRFLDSKLDTYNDRISSLEEKNTLLNEKIQRNQSKIDKFNSRIAKLEKQNIFLKLRKFLQSSIRLKNTKLILNITKIKYINYSLK